jgi:hypothetical protein
MPSRSEPDWDAPLHANGEARRAALNAALGLTMPNVMAFAQRLDTTISAVDWGYVELADIVDADQRAVSLTEC